MSSEYIYAKYFHPHIMYLRYVSEFSYIYVQKCFIEFVMRRNLVISFIIILLFYIKETCACVFVYFYAKFCVVHGELRGVHCSRQKIAAVPMTVSRCINWPSLRISSGLLDGCSSREVVESAPEAEGNYGKGRQDERIQTSYMFLMYTNY